MILSFALMTMLQTTPIVSIVDSRDDSSTAWIYVDDCRVEVKKSELKDFDAVLEKVDKKCNLKVRQ